MTLLRPLALALSVMVLVLRGAHPYELPGKADLLRDACFTVQGICSGWTWLPIPILGAVQPSRRWSRQVARRLCP